MVYPFNIFSDRIFIASELLDDERLTTTWFIVAEVILLEDADVTDAPPEVIEMADDEGIEFSYLMLTEPLLLLMPLFMLPPPCTLLDPRWI